ncbi:MAG: TSUP family transporter [Actinomycetota bacterium]
MAAGIADLSFAVTALALVAILASFTLSASAGLGGSLVLVPTLALILGTKQGVALAALLLAGNNIVKVVAYRKTLPYRKSAWILIAITLGAALGAQLLVSAPEEVVTVAVIAAFIGSMLSERLHLSLFRKMTAPVLAFTSGATSGFSGTSGPLKGVAIRNLDVDRYHFVGAASLASLAGDLSKAAVFAQGSLLGSNEVTVAVIAVPLMIIGTVMGRWINSEIGERGYTTLFWGVIAGYSGRLVLGL